MLASFVKIISIVGLVVCFIGMLRLAEGWFKLNEEVMPDKRKWLYVNPFLIFSSRYLTENGVRNRKIFLQGLFIVFIGVVVFLLMFGVHEYLLS